MLAGVAPQVVLKATHRKALEVCTLEDLVAHAVDPPSTADQVCCVYWCFFWFCLNRSRPPHRIDRF
jgi:hypothetical protein